MRSYVLPFHDIHKTKLAIAGGKGANLGELCRIEGIQVPDGFCITVDAYKKITANNTELHELLNGLAHLKSDQREKISDTGARIRAVIENIVITDDIKNEIESAVERLGESNSFAVRSSATAEDLPTASFAGQQDTFLNITGIASIINHISKCWASLFTDRAITYRIQNGFDHRKVFLAAIVQTMIPAEASGVLFTADPVSGNRKVSSIDAGSGLGDDLVSGLMNPDNYKINNGNIIEKQERASVLTDTQILELEKIGRKIEKHFASPQDIEWCLADQSFHIVQSRPITTLYPVPHSDDTENRVYVSVGHQQMMTDAMKPLGLSFFSAHHKSSDANCGWKIVCRYNGNARCSWRERQCHEYSR